MKRKLLVFSLIASIFATSCTDNYRARNFGGTETLTLKPNEKFVNITWKETNLWVIVQDTVTGDYIAREKSSWGVLEGTIIIKKAK